MDNKNGQNNSKRNLIITLLIVAVIALGSVWYFNYATDNETIESKQTTPTSQQVEEKTESSTEAESEAPLVTISEDGKTVSYQGIDDQTALALLKQYTTVGTEEYPGLGEYVVSINEVVADSTDNYWSFYVNGDAAQVGAGDYTTKVTDTVEWRLEDVSTFSQ